MNADSRIWVAGHRGLVGAALVRRLEGEGCRHLITATRAEVDLEARPQVDAFVARTRPEFVFMAAARVGGIAANSARPADFIGANLAMALNVIGACHAAGVEKLLFLGSSCAYPRDAPQPMREEHLLSGPLEPTNRPYAVAKIAGIELCRSHRRQHGDRFIACMPTNLYGPHDNFDLETSHVLPALLRRFHEAREREADAVTLWGTGAPRREFLHVDDLADACLHLMRVYEGEEAVNVGTGSDVSIRELAALVAEVVDYHGRVEWDAGRPDGAPRKLLDVSRLDALGWQARIPLEEGIRRTYAWYREHAAALAA